MGKEVRAWVCPVSTQRRELRFTTGEQIERMHHRRRRLWLIFVLFSAFNFKRYILPSTNKNPTASRAYEKFNEYQRHFVRVFPLHLLHVLSLIDPSSLGNLALLAL